MHSLTPGPGRVGTGRLLALAGIAAAVIALASIHPAGAGLLPAPALSTQIAATLATEEITLTGQYLGLPGSARELRLESAEGTIAVPATSPLVSSWGPTSLTVRLPAEARTGTVRVMVDGQVSNPADLFVYEYSHSAIPGPIGHPLHLDVGGDGRLWISEEFQSQLKALTADETPTYQQYSIPQASGPGIFAAVNGGVDERSRINILGEDIEVQPDGSVWFAQGGAYLYAGGANWNTSRIMRFDPVNGSFRCYVAARDDAEATSFVVDTARGMVWYLEAELMEGSAVSGFSWANTPSDCNFKPETSVRPALCSEVQVYGCHVRFPLGANRGPIQMALDDGGDLWISEYWSNRIARLDPDTGVVVELPLPHPRVTVGPGAMVGAGPHNLEFDDEGNLWLTEEFDATISLVRPALMATQNCTALDALGRNPCIEEVFVGTTGADGQNIHSLDIGSSGFVWFTYNGQTATVLANDTGANRPDPQIGFIATNHGNTVVLLPPLEGVRLNAGIVEDPASGEIWFAEYFERNIGRLHLAGEDGDGVPVASDNCSTVYNPSQANADGEFVDQTPPLGVDDGSRINSDHDGDACDPDDDNDGLSDTAEGTFPGMPGCSSAEGTLDPLNPDTDGDAYVDWAECAIGTNPSSSASKPTAEQCRVLAGAATMPTDTDGDKIQDRIEVCGYGTSASSNESDGDGAKDQCEIGSLNTLPALNSLDQLLLAQAIIADLGGPFVWNADLNKDGANNSADQLLMAQIILSAPGC